MATLGAHAAGEGDLDMQLLGAAAECDAARVKELLASGAKAAFIHDPPGTWGSCSKKGPLHAALQARPRNPSGQAEWPEGEERLAAWGEVVRTLVEARADVNAESAQYDWRGCGSRETAFEMALPAAMGDPALLELFLGAGADANTRRVRNVHSMRTDGASVEFVLHRAVTGGNLEVARALLDAGANVDAWATDKFHNERGFNQDVEETPLHRACAQKSPDLAMCALLIARGADVNAIRKELDQVDSGLESPTDDPRDDGFVPSVICVPVQETALHIAIRRKHRDLLVMLVCAGAELSVPRIHGDTSASCEDLCDGDEDLLAALRTEWTPETHMLFPSAVRQSVEAALMIARRQKWPLPETVLFRVCAMAVSPEVV